MLALEHFGDFNQRHIDLRFDRRKNGHGMSSEALAGRGESDPPALWLNQRGAGFLVQVKK